ncbi:MAG: histidine kinase dimerization/phospho-acceptor domain-containing protein [Limnobacter sp.]|nr:histidine kinase dimerization/phospho-acceptor domain-containing protein [Limnobacter sp.]
MHPSHTQQTHTPFGTDPLDSISHEINNPLAFVAANLNALNHNLNDLFELLECHSSELREAKPNSKSAELAKEYDFKNLKGDTLVLLEECVTEINRVKLLVQKLKVNQDLGVSKEPLALG